jgi:hypothetical protein
MAKYKKTKRTPSTLLIQSVSFDKEAFTKTRLKSWLKKYHLRPIKIETTANHHKARILSPLLFKKKSYVVKTVTPYVLLTLGKLKK